MSRLFSTLSVVLTLILAACGSGGNPFANSRAQPSPRAVAWRNPDARSAFAADSSQCASTAAQLAGSARGDTYTQEFTRCVHDKGWAETVRYVGADTCSPVTVSWVNPPNALAASTLDSLRRATEMMIAAHFYPKEQLRNLEARVALDLMVMEDGGLVPSGARVVSATGGNFLTMDYTRESAAREAVTGGPSNYGPLGHFSPLGRELNLSAVAALHARCLRDFKPNSAY